MWARQRSNFSKNRQWQHHVLKISRTDCRDSKQIWCFARYSKRDDGKQDLRRYIFIRMQSFAKLSTNTEHVLWLTYHSSRHQIVREFCSLKESILYPSHSYKGGKLLGAVRQTTDYQYNWMLVSIRKEYIFICTNAESKERGARYWVHWEI